MKITEIPLDANQEVTFNTITPFLEPDSPFIWLKYFSKLLILNTKNNKITEFDIDELGGPQTLNYMFTAAHALPGGRVLMSTSTNRLQLYKFEENSEIEAGGKIVNIIDKEIDTEDMLSGRIAVSANHDHVSVCVSKKDANYKIEAIKLFKITDNNFVLRLMIPVTKFDNLRIFWNHAICEDEKGQVMGIFGMNVGKKVNLFSWIVEKKRYKVVSNESVKVDIADPHDLRRTEVNKMRVIGSNGVVTDIILN